MSNFIWSVRALRASGKYQLVLESGSLAAGDYVLLGKLHEFGEVDGASIQTKISPDINSTDSQFGATPAGWAIEYLREMGGYLAIELEGAEVAYVWRNLCRVAFGHVGGIRDGFQIAEQVAYSSPGDFEMI